MNYDFEKEINKILDKVFKKAITSGYDADEVDAFFDEVIDYIKKVRELQQTLSSQLANKDREINRLNEKIKFIERQKEEIKQELEDLKKEGYSNSSQYQNNK